MTKSWDQEKFEKLKSRALGTYHFIDNQFGPNGPQSSDTGYVLTEDMNVNDMEPAEKFYRILFEDFPGTYFIGFDYTGTFEPYQKPLFTTEK